MPGNLEPSLRSHKMGRARAGARGAGRQAECDRETLSQNAAAGNKLLYEAKARQAVPYLEEAIKACPSDYPAQRNLILAYGQAGAGDKAIALAELALGEHDSAELHSLLGELYENQGNVQAAAAQYQKSAQMDPSEENVFNFGSSLLRLEGDSALRIFRFGSGKYPDSERMRLGLASALYGQGLTDEAVEAALRSSELNTNDPKAMEVLCQMEHIPADLSAAISQRLQSLATLYPKNAPIIYCYAMVLSGRWAGAPTQNLDKVIALMQKAIEIEPALAEAHFQLGEIYQEQGRTNEALHSYEQAVRFAPQEPSYHYRLALAYKRSGRLNDSGREMKLYAQLHEKER